MARRQLQPCGTPAAYRRHLYHGEEPCQQCRDAHNDRTREHGGIRIRNRARQRAYIRLASIYTEAFEVMLEEEYAKALAEEETNGGDA